MLEKYEDEKFEKAVGKDWSYPSLRTGKPNVSRSRGPLTHPLFEDKMAGRRQHYMDKYAPRMNVTHICSLSTMIGCV
ncbi:hypothetical protein CKAH01_12448 [Colletotrichum kahawae]|uniref:Uncharacterized protein n=1 Tax=Colletotrichum kahawae TaxID=34407 RepID=A0AAD9YQV4_COLKA|nr:hypothetical protein CKAH01_12448 [Colletotrichum kahawae]